LKPRAPRGTTRRFTILQVNAKGKELGESRLKMEFRYEKNFVKGLKRREVTAALRKLASGIARTTEKIRCAGGGTKDHDFAPSVGVDDRHLR